MSNLNELIRTYVGEISYECEGNTLTTTKMYLGAFEDSGINSITIDTISNDTWVYDKDTSDVNMREDFETRLANYENDHPIILPRVGVGCTETFESSVPCELLMPPNMSLSDLDDDDDFAEPPPAKKMPIRLTVIIPDPPLARPIPIRSISIRAHNFEGLL